MKARNDAEERVITQIEAEISPERQRNEGDPPGSSARPPAHLLLCFLVLCPGHGMLSSECFWL